MTKAVAEVKKLSSVASLPDLAAIQRELRGEDSASARIQYLNTVAADYRKAIGATKNYSEQTELFRSLHRIERCAALWTLRNEPVAWANRNKQQPDDL